MSIITVIGSSGNVGLATVASLSKLHKDGVTIRAAVRDPESDKAKPLRDLEHVNVVKGDMNDAASLRSVCEGATSVFVVTPGAENRLELSKNAVDAAVGSGVKNIVVVSVSTAGPEGKGTLFYDQFAPLEEHVKGSGISYVILRLPLFLDNAYGFQAGIKSEGKIYNPVPADKEYTPVAVKDVGEAAAKILLDPTPHANQTYSLSGPKTTYKALTDAFTKELGKEVEYVQVPYEAAREALHGMGMPHWQIGGVFDLFQSVEAGTYVYDSDIPKVLGRDPTTTEQWVAENKAAFQ